MCSLILHGRKSSFELQKKWCNLRVSVIVLQNVSALSDSFSSASAAADMSLQDGRKGKFFTVSYLVDSLGLTTKLAESISRKVSFKEKGNPDSVLSLLRNHGFTDSQISSIITIYPRLLIADAEKSLGPNLKFLQSRGASSSELTQIVSTAPGILAKKAGKSISRYYDFVKEIIEADKSSKFEKLCISSPLGYQENKIRNVSVLRELGVPQKFLFPLLNSNCVHVCGKEKFEESLKKVVEIGFDPTSSRFVQALRIVYGLSNKVIEEKVNVYKRLGFAVSDVWAMFKKWPMSLTHSEKKITQQFETLKKCGLLEDEVLSMFKKFPQCISASEQKIEDSMGTFIGLGFSRDEFVTIVKHQPCCLNYSAETLKKKTEYLVKKMNWPLNTIVSNPVVLGLSMEKRIIPRCNVIKALISKGGELPPIQSALKSTDEAFLNKYVMKQGKLMAIFTRKKRRTDKASE